VGAGAADDVAERGVRVERGFEGGPRRDQAGFFLGREHGGLVPERVEHEQVEVRQVAPEARAEALAEGVPEGQRLGRVGVRAERTAQRVALLRVEGFEEGGIVVTRVHSAVPSESRKRRPARVSRPRSRSKARLTCIFTAASVVSTISAMSLYW